MVMDTKRWVYFGQAPVWPQVGWRVTVPMHLAGTAVCDNDGRIWVERARIDERWYALHDGWVGPH